MVEPKRPKAYKSVEGELSTFTSNVRVTVAPDGTVDVLDLGNDSDLDENPEDNEKDEGKNDASTDEVKDEDAEADDGEEEDEDENEDEEESDD